MTKRTKTEFIIVHHSATGLSTTFESIKNWHINHNGWDSIGYHRVITSDGKIHNGMPLGNVGYHCKYGGYNFKSVGVCLTGNFCTGQDTPTSAQLRSLASVLGNWISKYNIPMENIIGHRKTGAATACPGIGLVNWLKEYRSGIIEDMKKEDVFKQCFITVAGRWPDADEVKEWKKSNNEIYSYVQANVKNPLIGKLEQEVKSLKTSLKTSRGNLSKCNEGMRDLTERISELEKELKELKGKEVKPEVNDITKKSLKELARVLLFALVSFGIAKLTSLPETETTVIGLAVLRTVDKVIHLIGKETGNEKLLTGLSRF